MMDLFNDELGHALMKKSIDFTFWCMMNDDVICVLLSPADDQDYSIKEFLPRSI